MAVRSGEHTEGTGRIRILVVEDQRLLVELLQDALARYEDFELVGVAGTAAEAWAIAAERAPDVVIMDYHLPDGTGAEATARIRERNPRTAVVMLTAEADEEAMLEAIEAGAVGYILKSEVVARLIDGVRRAASGEILLPPNVLADLLRRKHRRVAERAERERLLAALTSREREVLELLAQGLDSRAIADRLTLSYHTVRDHAQKVIEKLGARSRLEAVLKAKEHGLLSH